MTFQDQGEIKSCHIKAALENFHHQTFLAYFRKKETDLVPKDMVHKGHMNRETKSGEKKETNPV